MVVWWPFQRRRHQGSGKACNYQRPSSFQEMNWNSSPGCLKSPTALVHSLCPVLLQEKARQTLSALTLREPWKIPIAAVNPPAFYLKIREGFYRRDFPFDCLPVWFLRGGFSPSRCWHRGCLSTGTCTRAVLRAFPGWGVEMNNGSVLIPSFIGWPCIKNRIEPFFSSSPDLEDRTHK